MSSLRTIRGRIRSVQNTQKITRAMQMVAGAKLRRAQEELMGSRPYTLKLSEMAQRFLANHPDFAHPLLQSKNPDAPAGFLLISSDTGLCGTYNEKVLLLSSSFLREHPSAVVIAIGKKGNRLLSRREIPRAREILDWGGRYRMEKASELLTWMEKPYREGRVSSWWVAYTEFISALSWRPKVERVLPVEPPSAQPIPEKIILEPEEKILADALLTHLWETQVSAILLSAFTAEHSARMIAMRNATDNASEMIDHLTLVRNKARQAAITKELIEVVSGAEALK